MAQSTAPGSGWRTPPQEMILMIGRQTSNISLGGMPRVMVEIAGYAPITLDRWEFDAFSGKTKEADYVRTAVALRALCHESRMAFEGWQTLPSDEVQAIVDAAPKLLKQVDDVAAYLTRLGDAGDPAHARRCILTRDNLQRSADGLVSLLESAGNKIAREKPSATGPIAARSSSSGAFTRAEVAAPPAATAPPVATWKKALVPVLFAVAVVVAVYNLLPEPDRRVPIDAADFSDISPLEEAWEKDGVVYGRVTAAWYVATEEKRRELAHAMFARAKEKHKAKRLSLYQPGGTFLAASISDDQVKLVPRIR